MVELVIDEELFGWLLGTTEELGWATVELALDEELLRELTTDDAIELAGWLLSVDGELTAGVLDEDVFLPPPPPPHALSTVDSAIM